VADAAARTPAVQQWQPAFEGQRPPFQPGHELSTRHGAYSPRKVEPLARELVDAVLNDPAAAHAHAPAYRFALWAWAHDEAQVQLLSEYIVKLGEKAGNGVGDLGQDRVRAAYLLLHRAKARATTQRTRLGLDPLSRARLGKDVAAGQLDAARLFAELEKRDQPAAPQPPVAPGDAAP
jgi:hypothetical protein